MVSNHIDQPKRINPNYIGYIVGGGLKENLRVRLTVTPQEVQEGSFVVIESGNWLYYALVTDLLLGSTDPRFADEQSETRLPQGLASLLHGQTLYTNLEVLPVLMLDRGPELQDPMYPEWRQAHPVDPRPISIKTIPSHHAQVRLASAADVAEIFGEPDGGKYFIIGSTREQNHPVCIDLDKFVKRSSGIFGATGSGKSFLTRMILAGLIHYNRSSVLIFDMHNEYAFDDTASDMNIQIAGLRTRFPARVRVVSLGSGGDIRGHNADFNLVLAEKDILPEDIEMLTRELDLKDTTSTTLNALCRDFGRSEWFTQFKKLKNGATFEDEDGKKFPAPNSVEFWANQAGINPGAAEGLHRKLGRIFDKQYIVENPPGDSLREIIKTLEAGQHIILSFGKNESDLDYLLVTNLITRGIRAAWEKSTNKFRSQGGKEPRPLVITLEEAHKLLNREMAGQTTFSTIARELRKYYVTLLIVDQRPSQIYDEVMSQLGTRISGWLGDDSDIQAVLSGLAGRDTLRGMLSRLQATEEALLLGWGVPMPIPVRSRRYDDAFWEQLSGKPQTPRDVKKLITELYGDE